MHSAGNAQQEAAFEETLEDLRATLAEVTQEIGNEDERKATALTNFSEKLSKFETEAKSATTRWVEKGTTSKRFEHLEKMETSRDEIFEIAQELGAFRRSDFQSSLTSYKSQVQAMQYSIFIALGMLFISLFAVAWLAHRAFLKPIEVSLAEAEQTASTHESLATHVQNRLMAASKGDLPDGAFAALSADLEEELYRQAVALSHGNQSNIAKWLGVSRMTVRDKLDKYDLFPKRDR
ncbi:hypothetical protein N9283_03370 [Akkermansiaceae bacterium]|nr:hypothetical protein [Akkermansiaceae bacterium]MDB4429826.1 hypothetical protein [Akkermansiaceae bacterium]